LPDACDFSSARPTIAQLNGAGIKAVGRYLTGSGGKATTATEVASYVAGGIVVWFVYENLATDAQGGNAGGIAAATAAQVNLSAVIGTPATANQPIYFAVDENVDPSAVVGYFVGINRVLPQSRVGVYGDGTILNFLGGVGLANWFWQSSSSSYPGNATTIPAAHIQQLVSAPLPGTDGDQLLQGDIGQFPRP